MKYYKTVQNLFGDIISTPVENGHKPKQTILHGQIIFFFACLFGD